MFVVAERVKLRARLSEKRHIPVVLECGGYHTKVLCPDSNFFLEVPLENKLDVGVACHLKCSYCH